MEEEKVVPATAHDSAPVEAEDTDSELNPEELEEVQGGIQGGGQYLSDEDKARKRRAAGGGGWNNG